MSVLLGSKSDPRIVFFAIERLSLGQTHSIEISYSFFVGRHNQCSSLFSVIIEML